MDLPLLLAGVASVSLLTYWYLTRSHSYWRDQNVPSYPKPRPGFGHIWSVLSLKESFAMFAHKLYKSTEASMIGFNFILRPMLLVRDPELVKSIFQTNFTSFHSNMWTVNEDLDRVMSKNPFFIKDLEQWKVARARAVNHFSSRRLKDLFVIIREVGLKMSAFIDRRIKENNGVYECELKQLFTRYTGEIVANSAFAMEGQSFEDNPHRQSFTIVAPTIFKPTFLNSVKQALLLYLPGLAEFLRLSLLDKQAEAYFRENLKAIIKERKKSNIVQNDYLQYCIDANSEDNIDGIIADIIIFYLDVYETTSLVSAYLLFHLSTSEKVQSKLREHVNASVEANKGVIAYDSFKDIGYLDQVINETMRITPPTGRHVKCCTESITLVGYDGLKCRLKRGDLVLISSLGFNKDPKFWKDPEVFDPERFNPENQERNKKVFMPFGEGPRMCPGMRFANIMIKNLVVELITNFKLERSEKTKVPFEMAPTSFLMLVKGGLWAKFKKLSLKTV